MNPSKLQRIYISLIPIPFLALTFIAKETSSFVPHILRTPSLLFLRGLSSSSFEETDDDKLKWERMYYEAAGSTTMMKEDKVEKVSPKSEVRVVSFDLDNTLWNTSATIDAANDALAAFLDSKNIVQPIRVEKVMGELFRKNKSRYSPLDEHAKAPVHLTLLRKDGIQSILQTANGYSVDEAVALSEEAFEIWVQARHDAIASNMALLAVDCLAEISSMQRKDGHRIIIGAITDGNSDPKRVQLLAPFFDFCINAENVGVGKPDKRIYLEAIRQVASMPSMSDIFGDVSSDLSVDSLEEKVGPFWVHVGDDFIKDIVAGKNLNMRTVWCRELILDSLKPQIIPDKEKAPERSIEDLVKRVSEMKVVKMEIGADDYLSDMLPKEFADSVIDSFGELSSVLKDWHMIDTTLVSAAMQAISFAQETEETTNGDGTKFCIYCGNTLPAVAQFCSGCGKPQ